MDYLEIVLYNIIYTFKWEETMSDYILKEQGTKKDALADVSTEYILEMQNIRKEFLGGKIVANDDITLKIKTHYLIK